MWNLRCWLAGARHSRNPIAQVCRSRPGCGQPPAEHSTRQISEVLERIQYLYEPDVHRHLDDIPDTLLRRYARRLSARKPAVSARIRHAPHTIEVACFLRYCLLTATDQLILMVRRRVADLWRQAAGAITVWPTG